MQSKGPSRVFSNITVQKHQFLGIQPSLWSNSHVHTWLLGKDYLRAIDSQVSEWQCVIIQLRTWSLKTDLSLNPGLRRQWHPTPVLLPGESHVWRSMVGCSPWSWYELDMTERLHFHFSLSYIGEGNGNPLQCSCLENPRDGGAWWAAIYGVAQSRTRLKQLSSSSSRRFKVLQGRKETCFAWS